MGWIQVFYSPFSSFLKRALWTQQHFHDFIFIWCSGLEIDHPGRRSKWESHWLPVPPFIVHLLAKCSEFLPPAPWGGICHSRTREGWAGSACLSFRFGFCLPSRLSCSSLSGHWPVFVPFVLLWPPGCAHYRPVFFCLASGCCSLYVSDSWPCSNTGLLANVPFLSVQGTRELLVLNFSIHILPHPVLIAFSSSLLSLALVFQTIHSFLHSFSNLLLNASCVLLRQR